MSAVSGHLTHVNDNIDVSFDVLGGILQRLGRGELENVVEKVDGASLVFSWDADTDAVLVARSSGDILSGDVTIATLRARLGARNDVGDVFTDAAHALQRRVLAVPAPVRIALFGTRAWKWYAAEIVDNRLQNTVKYDGSNVVLHEFPVIERTPSGDLRRVNGDRVALLVQACTKSDMSDGWDFHGPLRMVLNDVSSSEEFSTALDELAAARDSMGDAPDRTLRDYIYCAAREAIKSQFFIDDAQCDGIAAKIADVPGSMHANDIKRSLPKNAAKRIAVLMRDRVEFQRSTTARIERAIYHLCVRAFAGLKSHLIVDNDAEVSRQRVEAIETIEYFEQSGNAAAIEFIRRHVARLEGVHNIVTPIEGIVFDYCGKTYKLTGAWRHLHQIVSLRKYGRKGITAP